MEKSGTTLHPVVMMLAVIAVAVALTYLVAAGQFQRHGALVVPGSYHAMPKAGGLTTLFSPRIAEAKAGDKTASAASLVAAFASIPAGLIRGANLIFLVMLVGGMFGVMRRTGAIDAGVDRLIDVTSGNRLVLIPVLMLVLALGSTFLGFISEYLVLIPIVALVGERLGYGRIFAVAVVAVAAKIGYATSVTNPYALVVAQPLAHVPLFSGLGYRLALFIVFIALGIGYVLWRVHPERDAAPEKTAKAGGLSWRHAAVLLVLLAAALLTVYGSIFWGWKEDNLSTLYVVLALIFALIGGLEARDAADAFVGGLSSMMLAGLLIGLAGSVQILLQNSYVLDTLIADVTDALHGASPIVTANGLMGIEMVLGVLIPSTAGKVAVSMPILAPIAQLSGVNGQTTVLAFILGNGLTNMITPTSGMLLAYLAAARVGFTEWLRFVAPLFLLLLLLSVLALAGAVLGGYS